VVDPNPAAQDRSGVRWVLGFDAALTRAKRERRILFLVPNTWFGKSDGDFGPGLESFRVGVLCDERIRRLLNRRFVPHYCNVGGGAPGFDAAALKFIVKVKKVFGKETQVFTGGSPMLFMAPNGKLLGEVRSSATADQVLDKMQKLLAKNRAYAARSKVEKGLKGVDRAELYLDLRDFKRAKQALKGDKTAAAQLALARVAREEGKWKVHARALQSISAPELQAMVRLETAYRHLSNGNYKAAVKALKGFPADHAGATEARYVRGLAQRHAGDEVAALATWKALVEAGKQDAWVYRADWAYCEVKLGPREKWAYGADQKWPSLLGRKSYLGPSNPDLRQKKRKRR
jgi:hypothetical protein